MQRAAQLKKELIDYCSGETVGRSKKPRWDVWNSLTSNPGRSRGMMEIGWKPREVSCAIVFQRKLEEGRNRPPKADGLAQCGKSAR